MLAIAILLLFTWFFYRKKTDGLIGHDLLCGWFIKLAFAGLYLWIYTVYYGGGELTADTKQFMVESKMLTNISNHSWKDYFTFLFGFESTPQIMQYLSETDHWSAGDLTLINDSKNVIRFNSLVYFFSKGNILIHILIILWLSTLCLRQLFLGFKDQVWFSKRLFWFGIIGLPSVAFWTGSVLKEPFLMMGFCLFISGVFGLFPNKKRLRLIVLGVLLMLLFKPYILGACFVAYLVYLLAKISFQKKFWIAAFTFFVFTLVAGFVFKKQSDKALHFLTRKQYDFINVVNGGRHVYADTCFFYFRPDQYDCLKFVYNDTIGNKDSVVLIKPVDAKQVTFGHALPFKDVHLEPDGTVWLDYFHIDPSGSALDIELINNSYKQLALNTAPSLINAAIRPTPFDDFGLLGFASFLETIGLFVFLTYSLIRKQKNRTKQQKQLIGFFLLASLIVFLTIGYTTPVIGAIVRYRIPAYLMLFLAASVGQKQKKYE